MGKLTDVYSNAELFKAYPELMLDNLREYMRDRDTAQSEYLKIKNRSPGELYKATAGEIEARDTANRANLTAGERKNTRPDIDRTDVVFANNSSESMEIVTLDNGKQYVRASESQVIYGNDTIKWAEQIANYINNEIRRYNDFKIQTVEGDVLTITRDTAYKAGTRNQIRNPDGSYRAMSDSEYLTKLNAEIHINELAEISRKNKQKNARDTKNHRFAKDVFSYRTAYFQDYDGSYYRITLSVGENGNVSTVYNVGKLKKDTLPNGNIKTVFRGSKADSVSNGITVTQKSPSVNSILSDSGEKITKFQKKLPDVQEKLKKMSGSDDIDDVKRMAYGLADDFMKYAKAARLEMTETRGLMPQPTRVSEIVAKYNDYRKTGVSNKQLESDITDIFTDYMNGVGSSGTLFNYITDTIMKRELNSYEVIGDETFKAVKAYTDGGRFKVSDATVGSLVDTFGSLGEINGILRENYGFTIAKETDTRAETRAVWAPVGAQLAEEAGYVFDGTDCSYTSKYTTENGYVTSRKVNQCESCEGCPYRNECHTSKYDRRIRVSHKLTEQNQKATELIKTDEGILLRMNRSVQVKSSPVFLWLEKDVPSRFLSPYILYKYFVNLHKAVPCGL